MNILKKFTIHFVSVPNLVKIFESQNQLAAQAQAQTAQNQTSANIAGAQINAETQAQQRRMAQEQKLAEFTQLMENMRNQSGLSSQERQVNAKLMADQAQGALGREHESKEKEIQRAFEKDLEQYRTRADQPLREAQITNLQAEAEQRRMAAPANAQKAQADADLTRAQVKTLSEPDVQGLISSLTNITDNKETRKALEKSIGKDGYKSLVANLTKQIQNAGVDTNTIPSVAEAEVGDVGERRKALEKEIDSGFYTKQIQQGADQLFNQRLARLQDLIASGTISSPESIKVARKRLLDFGKKSGVSKEYLDQI